VAAGNVERYHHPVARPDVGDLRPDLLDDTHRLVPEDATLFHVVHAEYLVQVQVGAADRRRRDAHDRVVGLPDGGVWNVVDPYVALAVPRYSLHLAFLS
jgi:hypothetical protein